MCREVYGLDTPPTVSQGCDNTLGVFVRPLGVYSCRWCGGAVCLFQGAGLRELILLGMPAVLNALAHGDGLKM